MQHPKTSILITAMALLAPFVVYGQRPQMDFGGVGQTIRMVLNFLDCYLVPLLFGVAFLVFIWGMVEYFILGGANDEKRASGKNLALWGVAGFVLMVCIWGIVNLLVSGFGFSQVNTRPMPTIPIPGTATDFGTPQPQSQDADFGTACGFTTYM